MRRSAGLPLSIIVAIACHMPAYAEPPGAVGGGPIIPGATGTPDDSQPAPAERGFDFLTTRSKSAGAVRRVPSAAAAPRRASATASIIYFAKDSIILGGEARSRLDALAAALHRPAVTIRILVIGHARPGPAKARFALSQRRADAVRDYLVAKGIDPARIAVRAMGADQPPRGDTDGRYDRVEIEQL